MVPVALTEGMTPVDSRMKKKRKRLHQKQPYALKTDPAKLLPWMSCSH